MARRGPASFIRTKIQPPATERPRRADVPPRTIFKSCGLDTVCGAVGQVENRFLLTNLL